MDARRRRATFDVTGIGPGQAVDRSEAKTIRTCHNQPKEPPESRPACRAGAEGEGEIERDAYRDLENVECRSRLIAYQPSLDGQKTKTGSLVLCGRSPPAEARQV